MGLRNVELLYGRKAKLTLLMRKSLLNDKFMPQDLQKLEFTMTIINF
jgi:hypothetical protein